VRASLDRLLLDGIKTTVQVALDALFAACLHAQPYERTDQRQGYRKGSRERDLLTRCGRVEDIQVPRDREGQFQPLVFERWQRLEDPLADALRQMYLEGVSTRAVAAITTALCPEDLSASRMRRLNEELTTQLQQWRERPLSSAYPYVYLDAVYAAVNWGGAVTDLAILVAVGVNEAGYREIIGVGSGDAESAETWREFLRSLKERGLTGVRLVISAAPSGLKRALRAALPCADWQRCDAHFERNILSHVSPSAQAEVGRTLSRLFQSEAVKEARAQAEELAQA
jgi:transposase-like protein